MPLSCIMQNLTFRYTRWFNWRLKRIGHLFQGRYKAILVDADSYLIELAAYIHLNPVRAVMIDKAEDYEWSSHKAYCGTEQITWLNTEYILSLFLEDHSIACQLFSRYVSDRSNDGHREEFYGKASLDSRVMGEDIFVENILAQNEDLQPCKPTLGQVGTCGGPEDLQSERGGAGFKWTKTAAIRSTQHGGLGGSGTYRCNPD